MTATRSSKYSRSGNRVLFWKKNTVYSTMPMNTSYDDTTSSHHSRTLALDNYCLSTVGKNKKYTPTTGVVKSGHRVISGVLRTSKKCIYARLLNRMSRSENRVKSAKSPIL